MTFTSNAVVSAVVVLLSCVASAAQTPGEVQDLRWCAGSARDCLGWTPVAGADSYRVHLGEDVSLYCVASDSPDSSWRLVAGPPASGAFPENPPAGRFFWYLVAAQNAWGVGPFGNASGGPRQVDGTVACATPCRAVGQACSGPADCCSGVCSAPTCLPSCCGGPGVACRSHTDCCEGNSCSSSSGTCCRNVFLACGSASECCTGGCAGWCCYPDGSYSPGCLAPCCNGCFMDICGAACTPSGGSCGSSMSCCSGVCFGSRCQ